MLFRKFSFLIVSIVFVFIFSTRFLSQSILPNDLSGLNLWLKSDVGVNQSAGSVSNWVDQSGLLNSCNQNSVANRPTLISNVSTLNNYPVIRFDGTNDFLIGTTLSNINNSSFTIFVVANGESQSSSIASLFSIKTAATGFYFTRRPTANKFSIFNLNTTINSTSNFPSTGYNYKLISGIKVLGTSFTLRVNGSQDFNSTTPGLNSSFTNANYQLGAGNSANFFKGDLAEVIIYNRELTSTEITQVESYILNKYAPPVNLGADINDTYGFEDITLSTPGSFSSYSWQTSSGILTTPTINVNNPGQYILTATDIFGRVSSDTINITRPDYGSIQLSSQLICYNGNTAITAPMPVGDYQFVQWSDGVTTQTRSITQTINLSYVIKDNANFTRTSNTATFTFDNSLQNVSLGNDTILCQGNFIQLAQTSPTISSYLWSTGATTNSIPISLSGEYILTITNNNGCSKSDIIEITIQGQSPTIQLNFPTQFCQNESATFSETSFVQNGEAIGTRLWSFGNNTNSNLSSGTLSNNITGTYNGLLTVTSINGCQSSQSFSYVVLSKPSANYTSPLLCDNVVGEFTNTSTSSQAVITASEWLVNDLTLSTATNFSYSHPTLGPYNLTLVVTDSFGCKDTSSQTQQVINTYPIPNTPYLVYPFNGKTVLSNEQVTFSWSSVENNYFYELQFSNSSNFSPISNTISTVQNNYTWTPNTVGTIYWRVKANNPCLLGGTSPVFSINSIQFADSLRLWLRADNGVTLNGSSVNTWLDGSSNGLNAIQNTVANQPLFISSNPILNQKPSIKFDGINDVLTGGLIPRYNTNSLSVFVIGSGGNQSTTNAVMFSSGASSTGWWFTRRASAGRIGVSNNNNSLVGATTTLPTTGYDFKLFGYNKLFGTSAQIKVNGVNEISSTNATAIGGFTNANYQVGAGNSTNYLNGEIAEIMAFTNTLTPQEETNVEKYLMDKYARPIDLGPDIISTYGFCDITLSSNGYFQSYSWSTGATTSSIQINEPGIYSVQAVDIFGRTTQDQIVVSRPVYDSISLTNQLVCFNAPQSYTAFVPNGYQFVSWSDGYLTPSRILSESTSFSYTIIDSNNCQRTSNTATITIDSSLAIVSLGADTSLCIGNSISLVNTPTNISSYLWNDNSTASSSEISAQGAYWVEVTNTNNCSNRDSISVSIIGTAPILQYSFSDTLCQFSPGSYLDNSFVPNGNGTISSNKWFISNGDTLTASSGSFSIDTSGIFNVTLLVETEEGCSSSATLPLVVHPKPILSFSTQNYCPYEEIQFTPLNSTLLTLNSFLWEFNQNNNSSTASNPNYSFGQSGIFNVSLQAEDINGCRDTVVQPVYIQPAPVADFSFNNTCELSAVNFANNSSIADTFSLGMSQWTYGDGTASTNPAIQKVYQGYGEYDVQLVVTANNGCQDTISQTITIHPKPILGWQVGPACKNTWTSFENQSTIPIGSITQTDWLVNLQYPFEGPSSEFLFVTTGEQYLNLTSTSDQGCSTDTLIIVNVQPEIIAAFTVSPTTVVAGVPVVFTNNSLGGTSYEWNLGNGNIIQTTVAEPVEATGFSSSFIGDSILTYLAIQNAIGCKDTAYQYVKINEPRIDLAINQLFVQDINGFYKVGVELRNLGFVEITQTDLLLKLYNSSPILETETESLAPGASRIYLFNANPSAFISTQDNEISFLCVEATSYNDYQLVESELSNNISCLNTEGGNFVLLPIYPNPTNDDVTYTLIVSEESTISTSLTDETGRIVQSSTELFASGLHTPTISMRNLRAGVYYFQISDGVTSKTVKVLKN